MKYRIEFCGVWSGSPDPVELTEIVDGEVKALKRFEELESHVRQSNCEAFKICLNLERNIKWGNSIRYTVWPLVCANDSQ